MAKKALRKGLSVRNTNSGEKLSLKQQYRMNLSTTSLFLLLLLTACTSEQANNKAYASKGSLLVFDSTFGKYIESAADKKLISTWENFTEAVSNADYSTLRRLSLDSIICDNCVPTEENPTLAADTFYNQHAAHLFSKSFSALLDRSKVRCSYGLDSTYFYAHPFLTTVSDMAKPKLAVMVIEYPVLNSESEHNSGLFGFLETQQGYKFFGYSTIP